MQRLSVVLFVICSVFLSEFNPLHAEPSRQELNQKLQDLKQKEKQFKEELNSTLSKQNRAKKKYNKTRQKENHILEIINRYKSLQEQSKQRLENLKQREKRAKERLETIDEKFANAKERLRKREDQLRKRLRSIYKQGQLMQTRMLISASNISELISNYRYYKRLVDHDKEVISNYQDSKKEIKQLRERRKRVYQQRKSIRKKVEETLNKRERILQSRRSFLEEIQNEKNLYKRRLNELEEQQQQLKEKVFLFQKRRNTTKKKIERIAGRFGKRKGELPWPVTSREILRPYGRWTKKGIVHNNDGVDIGTETGQEVRVISSGEVVFANRYDGIGKVVIVRHNDNFITLYGSLIEIMVSEGQKVEENTVIGRAGRTAGMDQPRLYFQIFEGKETLNPIEWLR